MTEPLRVVRVLVEPSPKVVRVLVPGLQGPLGPPGPVGPRGVAGASTLSPSQSAATALRTIDGYGFEAGIVAERSDTRELVPLVGIDPRGDIRIADLGGAHPGWYPHPYIGWAVLDRDGNFRWGADHLGGLLAATDFGNSKFFNEGGLVKAMMPDGTSLQITGEADATVVGGVDWRVNKIVYIRRAAAIADDMYPFAGADTHESLTTLMDASVVGASLTTLGLSLNNGQSQAEAAAAETVLPAHLQPVAPGKVFMFYNGPRSLGFQRFDKLDIAAPWSNYMRLRNYAEQNDSGAAGGLDAETIGWQRAYDRINLYNLMAADEGEIMLNVAIGSTRIDHHAARGPRANWQRAMVALRAGCMQTGRTPKYNGMVWRGGAADRAKTAAEIEAALVALRDELDDNAERFAGVTDLAESYLYVAQSADPYTAGSPHSEAAIGTLRAALHNTRICCVGPDYIFQVDGSLVHFTNLGSRQAGAYQAYFESLCAAAGGPVAPLHVTGGSIAGTTVTLNVHNPLGTALVRDTSWVSNPALTAGHEDKPYGFKFRQTGGAAVTVTDVNVSGSTQIILSLSGTATGSNRRIGIADEWNDAVGGPGTGGTVPGGARCCIRNTGPAHAIGPNGRLDMYLSTDEIVLS